MCSDLIDKESQKYTKDVVLEWKVRHENYIAEGGGLPKLPEIKLQTQRGLTLPDVPSVKIQGSDIETYREHVLSIYNPNDRALSYFECRIQFPEPIAHYSISDSPVGAAIQCAPDKMSFVANASGSGTVTFHGGGPALDYKIAVDAILPKARLVFHFLSVKSAISTGHVSGFSDDALEYHVLGGFQYSLYGDYLPRQFLVPLEFDAEKRSILSFPCEERDRTRRILIRQSS